MHTTVDSLFQAGAQRRPDAVALLASGKSVTYRELSERVDRLASGFVQAGCARGDRVCCLAHNSVDLVALFGACARLGLVACPLNWRLSEEEIGHALDLMEPRALIVDEANLASVESIDTERIALRLASGGQLLEGWRGLEDFGADVPADAGPPAADDPFVILGTAAMHGVARGAVLTHANLVTACEQLVAALGLTESDRHLAVLPMFHVTGLVLSLATLMAGGTNLIAERFDPQEASALLDEHKGTLFATFPPILSTLLDAREAANAEWGSLRHVLGLDAPETIQRLLTTTSARFWTGYGQSETSGVVTLTEVREKPGSVGKALPGAEVRCFAEDGHEVAVGAPGEIVVRGPQVFREYWRDPDATRFASRHAWHHTGDIGRFDEDGYLYYLGRTPEKDLIKSGGENVYPAEVEHAIAELPQVKAVCVIGTPDETWGEAVRAVVELEQGTRLTAAEIIQAVAERIAPYKKPRSVVFVEALPRTPDGRIARDAVKDAHG